MASNLKKRKAAEISNVEETSSSKSTTTTTTSSKNESKQQKTESTTTTTTNSNSKPPLFFVHPKRIKSLNEKKINVVAGTGTKNKIIYWMSRDQRADDNWALIYAQQLANQHSASLCVVFCLVTSFMNAPYRHFDFMLNGLEEVEKKLKEKNIPFIVLEGEPQSVLVDFVNAEKNEVIAVVNDFSPMKLGRVWKEKVASALQIPLFEVDAHNVVPAWVSSDKQEWAAKTIRPKIHAKLSEYLIEYPKTPIQKEAPTFHSKVPTSIDWPKLFALVKSKCDTKVGPVKFKSGTSAGLEVMKTFFEKRLDKFGDNRNDPNLDVVSGLSPYLHFGQLSAATIALAAKKDFKTKKGYDSFIEEMVVRRELAENFCFYNKNYDNLEGFPDWARKTLKDHEKDKREVVYTDEQFEQGKTYDKLWNAAQLQMTREGKMHGYMRMYWAKKILEWTSSPSEAMRVAVWLNDKYEIDGRDPNGYVGCAWSIGGVHDQGWKERPVFGKIRYMNYAGCERKFNVAAFIAKYK